MKRYGVGHVVIEDRTYPEGPLRCLQTLVTGSDFELVQRIPILSLDHRLRRATLSIYRIAHPVPAAEDARLGISEPLMNGAVGVPVGDLLTRREP